MPCYMPSQSVFFGAYDVVGIDVSMGFPLVSHRLDHLQFETISNQGLTLW